MAFTESIIKKMGYDKSEHLYRRQDFNNGVKDLKLSHKTIRLLKRLNPYACYFVNNKPFVIFFERPINQNDKESIHNKVWNAQIPVAIFDYKSHLEIYNGFSLNQKQKSLHLVEELKKDNINSLSLFSYWNVTDKRFWEEYYSDFSKLNLDESLLDNINHLIIFLRQKSCKPFAIKLTLRLIFIRFLIDRNIDLDYEDLLDESKSVNEMFLEIIKSKEELYKLFKHLKVNFNGNLFEYYVDKHTEMSLVNDEILNYLHDFLSGKIVLGTNQLTLFPLYDFSIIPVELISNIYERLLGSVNKQRKDAAFYTPIHLVDYIFEETIKLHLKEQMTFKILDPSCGSGIFLVESLRHMIEKNLGDKEYFTDDAYLTSLLTNNIYGIDKNPEAIEVAIFSLYLTLLDYKDPKSLKSFRLPILKGRNFFSEDFFSNRIDKQLEGIDFDFIIGNPPWGSVSNKLHLEYCKQNKIPTHYNEISRSFLARTKDFANEATQCCLIVTSKIFYNSQNKAKEFRKWLLSNATIERFIELAPVRELIFKNAKGPASVLFYNFNRERTHGNNIEHITVMPNLIFKLFKLIVIESSDFKYIPQEMLYKDDWAWKTLTFGTKHDYLTIRKLKDQYKTMRRIIDENNLSKGVGIQVGGGDNNDASHLVGKLLLDAKSLTSFNVNLSNCKKFTYETVHRSRKGSGIFNPPYVLFRKGIDSKTYKYRAAYLEKELIYTDAVYGISGEPDFKEILLSFTGLLNSKLYAYLNLMLGSSTGIEREQAFPTTALEYPVIVDKEIAEKVKRIQKYKKQDKSLFGNKLNNENVNKLQKELDEYILSCFDLDNDPFINYVLDVQIPLLTGDSTRLYQPVTVKELEEYSRSFMKYWSRVLINSDMYVQITIYPSIIKKYAAMEVEFVNKKPNQPLKIYDEHEQIELMSRFMLYKYNDLFYQKRDIINFEENSFYILKSNEYKNWHHAISEMDLSKVIDSVFSGSEYKYEWI